METEASDVICQVHTEEKQARQQLSIICSPIRGSGGRRQRGLRSPNASFYCKTTRPAFSYQQWPYDSNAIRDVHTSRTLQIATP